MIGLCRPGEFGECTSGIDPHHIISRGAGGGDEPQNIIALCRRHHNLAHARRITKDDLREILTERFGYHYG